MFATPPVRWKNFLLSLAISWTLSDLFLMNSQDIFFLTSSLEFSFSLHLFWHLFLVTRTCRFLRISSVWVRCQGLGARLPADTARFPEADRKGQISWRTARWRGPVNYTGTYYTLLYINFQRGWIVYINICWYILYDMICMISYILYVFICTLLHIPYYTCVCSVSILYTIC